MLTESPGPQFHDLAPDYQRVLLRFQKQHSIELRLLEKLTGGRSGAQLFLTTLASHDSGSVQHVILKLDRPRIWGDDWQSEPERHSLAAELASPEFAEGHMAELVLDPTEDDGVLLVLYSIAGRSLQRCRPLASAWTQGALKAIYSTVGQGLLDDWNGGWAEHAPPMHPQEILACLLGYRLDPREGHIHEFLSEQCGCDPDIAGLIAQGNAVPNPYAYATQKKHWGDARSLDLVRGFVHGDLNTRNVLVEFEQYGEQVKNYYLIDFANFQPKSVILYDHAYLELSYLLDHASRVSTEDWILFVETLAADEVPRVSERVPSELAGPFDVISSMRAAINAWVCREYPSLRDDLWGLYRLGAVAAGLNFCNKPTLPREERFLALVFSSLYCQAQCILCDSPLPESAADLTLLEPQYAGHLASTWEPFLQACGGFSGARVYILIAGPDLRGCASDLAPLGRVPWSMVLDFDPDTQDGGLNEYMRDESGGRRSLHFITCEDSVSLNPARATYWYAARGLRGRIHTLPKEDTWLAWKLKYDAPLGQTLCELARSSGEQPALCLILWNAHDYITKACDLVTRAFGDRVDLVFATPNLEPLRRLQESYGAQAFPLEPRQIAAGLAKLIRPFHFETKGVSLPGAGGVPVTLSRHDTLFLQEEMSLVHLTSGVSQESDMALQTSFLHGNRITWFELGLHRDVDRNKTNGLRTQIEHDLDERLTTRVNLYHCPGAGGTTVARRIAWDLHEKYPVVLLHRVSDGTIGRLLLLRDATSLPVLAVVETAEVPLEALEQLYSATASEGLAVVFLIVSRRFKPVSTEVDRVRYLREQLDSDEAGHFAEVYGSERPSRLALLRDLAQNEAKRELRNPFFFGLMAFEEAFTRLDTHVEARLQNASEVERRIMVHLALAYAYAQQALPAQFFTRILSLPGTATVRLDRALDERRQSLLLREVTGGDVSWRPAHQLIAKEICVQILAGNAVDRRVWHERLSDWAIMFIRDASALYDATAKVPSEKVLALLTRLFLFRDSRDTLGVPAIRPTYSHLISDIPVPSGQLSVFRALVQSFPEEPHFEAHLARCLSLQGEYLEALEHINRALELDDRDYVLYHIKGMVLRQYGYSLMREALHGAEPNKPVPATELATIQHLWRDAEEAFSAARVIAPDKEHAYVSHIQLLARAIEFGFKLSGKPTYADFLRDDTSLEYQEKLELAEGLLSDLKSLRGGEGQTPSSHAQRCEARLNQVVGEEYSQVIDAWSKLLRRPDIYKPPIRRRLAYAYLGSRRSWEDLDSETVEEIVKLMEQNMLAEPDNERNIRLWFQAARRSSSVTLDSAIEKLSYWHARSAALDAVYYLYVLQALKAIGGSATARVGAEQLIEESRRRARNLQYRTRSFNWLGKGSGMKQLVHYTRLGEWDRVQDFWTSPEPLHRTDGLIVRAQRPEAGLIELSCGLRAFFVPARSRDPDEARFTRERHENTRVTLFLGFSYDGLRAWSVKLE